MILGELLTLFASNQIQTAAAMSFNRWLSNFLLTNMHRNAVDIVT